MENTTKNTPGPWKADGTAVYAEEDGIDQEIAWCYYADDTPLVAAAPELLEALEDCVQYITANLTATCHVEYGGVNLSEVWLAKNKTLQKANAVIKKAKGE